MGYHAFDLESIQTHTTCLLKKNQGCAKCRSGEPHLEVMICIHNFNAGRSMLSFKTAHFASLCDHINPANYYTFKYNRAAVPIKKTLHIEFFD
jgi:hypothetical protein